jgi:beta-phosphoglucomutase family hydrolase
LERYTMSAPKLDPAITRERFDAVLFDLDGVITATAKVHAACWKEMFDEYLKRRAERNNEPFRPFDIEEDYKLYVDGKPRLDGVRGFLESRGIDLPTGGPESSADSETIMGLGTRKDQMVKDHIATEGVEVYEGSLAFIRTLHDEGFKTAVVSSSKNCLAVLQATGTEELFDVRVDGEVAARLKLPGKPAPDTFLKAAEELGVDPARAVVVEDAIVGVKAGRNGKFGLVIGVAREENGEVLKQSGADIVVSDMAELLR